MAEYDDTETEEGGVLRGAPAPMLQEFEAAYDQPGASPAAQEWAGEVTTRLNDYFQRRQIADDTEAAGQQFVADLDGFKSGLVSMVTNDPHAVNVALDLVEITPSMLGDNGDLTAHMQGEVAAAAITSAAEQDESLARSFLANPRIQTVLGENAAALESYIGIQAQARAVDQQAQADELRERAFAAADRSAVNYLGALHDPVSGALRFPPGWNQAVMADRSLPPAAKVAVSGLYNRLREEGDAPASNPYLILDAAQAVASGQSPTVASLALEAGRGLTIADAMLLLGGTGPVSLGMRREFGQLASTLNAAQQLLSPPENGAAGERAFGRFTDWLMGEYRARGPGSLNINNENAILTGGEIQAFAPTATDLADMITVEPLANMAKRVTGTRVPLKDIFNSEDKPRPADRYRVPKDVNPPRGYEVGADGGFQPIVPHTNPNGPPYYGAQAILPSQRIRGGSQRINPEDPEPTEILTDLGVKQLSAADMAFATSAARPKAAPNLNDDQIKALLEGGKLTQTARSTPTRPLPKQQGTTPRTPTRQPRRR